MNVQKPMTPEQICSHILFASVVCIKRYALETEEMICLKTKKTRSISQYER